MKLSLPPKLVGKLVWVPVILFCKISFPVTHLMPYYAKIGSPPSPPNRPTLRITFNIWSNLHIKIVQRIEVYDENVHNSLRAALPIPNIWASHSIYFSSPANKQKNYNYKRWETTNSNTFGPMSMSNQSRTIVRLCAMHFCQAQHDVHKYFCLKPFYFHKPT
jgi:hypothetical protein